MSGIGIKWDGEWKITYETFRDMGIAYSVGLPHLFSGSGRFRSYLVPLIIMVPIPLTLVGVMPGHALLGAPFTATSMIGMIARYKIMGVTPSCWWTLSTSSGLRAWNWPQLSSEQAGCEPNLYCSRRWPP